MRNKSPDSIICATHLPKRGDVISFDPESTLLFNSKGLEEEIEPSFNEGIYECPLVSFMQKDDSNYEVKFVTYQEKYNSRTSYSEIAKATVDNSIIFLKN